MQAECPWTRKFVVEYSVEGADFNTINYRFVQCVDDDQKTVKDEKISYQLPNSDEWHDLPQGCLPPTHTIEPPKVDECKMNYELGSVTTETIAKLVAPQFLEDSENNPIEQEDAFVKYKNLLEERDKKIKETTSLEEFNQRRDEIVDELQRLVNNFVEEKVKCFEEKVFPVEKTTIEVVCAEQGAHQSIESAIKAAFNDKIDCGHVNC